MYELLKRLLPIHRSMTGDGARKTFQILKEKIPLELTEVPSGTQCFDWVVPDEWNIESAWIKDPAGNIIVDFDKCNLCVVAYSEPVSGYFHLNDLKNYLHYNPSKPDLVPYLTSYFKRRWGFCMSLRQIQSLQDGIYEVNIKSSFKKGSLTFAEAFIPGNSSKEVVLSCYSCHPSMANDSLSGIVLAVSLYEYIKSRKINNFSYRFIFTPETIGTIAYLSKNKERIATNTYCALFLTYVAGHGAFCYNRTKNGNHAIDKVAENVLKHSGFDHVIRKFFIPGGDERYYSAPGFNIPSASLVRPPYGYHEYHSSADDLRIVTQTTLEESFVIYKNILDGIDGNDLYISRHPYCEPFLSKYNLHETVGASALAATLHDTTKLSLYLLNFADGKTQLIDIAEREGFDIIELIRIAKVLEEKGLLDKVNEIKA